MRIGFTILVLLLLAPNAALACLSPFDHKQTFLKELPKQAELRASAAKVKILSKSYDENTYEAVFEVVVIEEIHGIMKDRKLTVRYLDISCTGGIEYQVGDEYYIAGQVNSRDEFYGIWRGLTAYSQENED